MRQVLKSLLGHPALTRRAARRAGRRVVALCYHDLRDDDDFGNWLRVPVSLFDRQLAELGRVATFLRPEQLDAPDALDPTRLHVLLTFDDGYANNLRLALPVLERHRAPALVFVSTGPLLSQRAFWPDVVLTPIQALRLDRLDLRPFGFADYRFRRRDDADRWEDLERVLVDLKRAGNPDHPRVKAVLDHLAATHADTLAAHLPRFRPLDAAEASRLTASGLVRLGSHSHEHVILTRLDDAELERNLQESRRLLSGIAGADVVDLAYPNGDWDGRVAERAAAAGYVRAWTTRPGLVTPRADRLSLPRVMVGGYDVPATTRFQINRLLLAGGNGA